MESEKSELLSVIDYAFTEEFFKDKIGTGEELKDLINQEIVIKKNDKYFEVKKFEKQHLNEIKKRELHQNIADYYKKKLYEQKVEDYSDFLEVMDLSIKLAQHLNYLKKYDESISYIFKIAKKMIFWGKRDILYEVFNKYLEQDLTEQSIYRREYFVLLDKIVLNIDNNLSEKNIINKFQDLDKELTIESKYSCDIKNLKGIFNRLYKTNYKSAIKHHQEVIAFYENQNDIEYDDYVRYGINYENLAFCYIGKDNECVREYFIKAQECLEKSKDVYELAKLVYYKMCLEFIINEDAKNIFKYVEEYNKCTGQLKIPDIERNIYNLLADKHFIKKNDIESFFECKAYALDCDLVLYSQYFEEDFYSILNFIESNYGNYKNEIVNGLKILINFFRDVNMRDEINFIEGLNCYLNDKDYNEFVNNITNGNLRELFGVLINKLIARRPVGSPRTTDDNIV